MNESMDINTIPTYPDKPRPKRNDTLRLTQQFNETYFSEFKKNSNVLDKMDYSNFCSMCYENSTKK